jgi:hypothetical protein
VKSCPSCVDIQLRKLKVATVELWSKFCLQEKGRLLTERSGGPDAGRLGLRLGTGHKYLLGFSIGDWFILFL